MLEFENTIPIERPIDELFAFLSDFENIPKWNYYVLQVRQLSESPIGIGTTYHQFRKTDEQDSRIIEFEPNNTVAVKTLPQSSPRFERRFTLYEEGETTRIRHLPSGLGMEALHCVESPIGVLKIGEKASALYAIEEGSKRQS